jgi:hypothetical protein
MTVCEREARSTETKNASKASSCPPEAMKSQNEEKEICFYSKRAPIGCRNSVAKLLGHLRIWIGRRNFICDETSWTGVEP